MKEKMDYLVKDQKLELKYEPGKGAWTYHIQIPNTKHLVCRWGFSKVSGFIDKILDDILAQKTDNQQIKMTMKYIDRLGL